MPGERRIQPVKDRKDKQKTYQEQLSQYKKALRDGFWFEAIMIDYACLEDRLRYMLFYLGVLTNEKDYKIIGKNQRINEFRSLLHEYKGPNLNMGIQSISGKRNIIESIFRFAAEPMQPGTDSYVRKLLWNTLHDNDHDHAVLDILHEIEVWCGYRNEIVHSLLNKNLESLYEQVKDQAKKGYELFRRLDLQVQWVKRKKLREKMKLRE